MGRSTFPLDKAGEMLIGDGRSPFGIEAGDCCGIRFATSRARRPPWRDVVQLSPNPRRLPDSMPGGFHGGNVPSKNTASNYSRLTVHNLDPRPRSASRKASLLLA